MSVYGRRHNAKGRATPKLTSQAKKHFKFEGPFIAYPVELLRSPAWFYAGINCRRFVETLNIEHVAHSQTENGRLIATYDQLVEAGIPRKHINEAIEEAEFLGLVRVEKAALKRPSRYALTFHPTVDENGLITPRTNDWKKRTAAQIEAWRQDRTQRRTNKRTKPWKNSDLGSQLSPTVGENRELPSRKPQN